MIDLLLNKRRLIILTSLLIIACIGLAGLKSKNSIIEKTYFSTPLNQLAGIHISGKQIDISYNGKILFREKMNLNENEVAINQVNYKSWKAVKQVINFTTFNN